jgi:Domain of unknown function (DUF5664)
VSVSEIDIKDYKNDGWKQPTAVKYDTGKLPISLIDPEYIEGLAKVLGFGANKYAAHNWRGGIQYSRLISAAYRHLGAINKGEDLDPESGLPHVFHLACCNMFLASMIAHRPDMDDRYKLPESNLKGK